jgi:tetratricopeptide (TPR) repeat protein
MIPDGYNGTVKQLTCRICKHIFYLTMADYDRLQEVHHCHECSLILREELGKNQMASGNIATKQTPLPASLPFKQTSNPVRRSPEQAYISRRPSIPVPQPRTIDRDKMTVAQLLEETKMLNKTWRYKEALTSYEQVLQHDAGCLAAFYGKGAMLSQLGRTREALAVYEEILRLDPCTGYLAHPVRHVTGHRTTEYRWGLERDPQGHGASLEPKGEEETSMP